LCHAVIGAFVVPVSATEIQEEGLGCLICRAPITMILRLFYSFFKLVNYSQADFVFSGTGTVLVTFVCCMLGLFATS